MTELYHEVYVTWERVVLAGWGMLCTVLGLSGNLLIVLTTSKFNPISQIDTCTVIFIKHLAIADILYIVTRILPATISHIAGGWVLGAVFCDIEGHIYFVALLASGNLVLAITSFKLFVLTFPLKARTLSSCAPHLITAIIWIHSSMVAFLSLVLKVPSVVNPKIETICEATLNNTVKLEYSLGVVKNVQLWIPAILNPFFTLALWFLAYKHTRIMKRVNANVSTHKAVVTVLAVGLLFFVVWLPTVIEDAWRHFAPPDFEIPLVLNKAHITIYWITTFCNPIFYVLINRRYRDAAKKHLSTNTSTVVSTSH